MQELRAYSQPILKFATEYVACLFYSIVPQRRALLAANEILTLDGQLATAAARGYSLEQLMHVSVLSVRVISII
jgi:hypothetical protein